MKLFRTRVWPWYDIASLKLCCLLLGMIAGAYCADFTQRYVWLLALAALLLAIRPFVTYFGGEGKS